MAIKNQLQKFYNAFGGLDTRSNKLLMSPSTFRRGSKNWRVNFQDEYQNANGYQHKDSGAPAIADIFEYKFNDINTGESKVQNLGVGLDGHLYRMKKHFLHFITHGAATSYSVFYDEVGDTFKISLVGLSDVNISDTMTMDQLKTALNALAGVSVSILDDAGVSVTSTKLAYLLDCVIENDFEDNPVYFWERVPFPDITCVAVGAVTIANLDMSDPTQFTYNSVPFPTTVAFYGTDNYEGVSSINYGNSIYITDGAFPLKYDGKTVYRSGIPKVIETKVSTRTLSVPPFGTISPFENVTGIATQDIAPIAATTALPDGEYAYKQRFAFTDYNGATTFGDIIEDSIGPEVVPLPSTGRNFQIATRGLWYGKDFPIYACRVNGAQSTGVGGAGVTLTVDTGHNILPGMVIRQSTSSGAGSFPAIRSTSKSFINFNALVTQVTATTITLAETVNTAGDLAWSSAFLDDEILNGYFTQDFYINKRPFSYYAASVINPVGAFLQVFRTEVDATTGPFYNVYNMPLPAKNGDKAVMIDDLPDATLEAQPNLVDLEQGSEIPRACKYLTKWQNQIVQSGNPVDTEIQNDNYPSVFYVDTNDTYSQESIDTTSYYTEALLCDLQSIYWADALTPEGFPQDGLHEFLVDTLFSDRVKAIAPNKDALFALKERSTGVLTGDLANNDIVLEVLEADVGTISHRSVSEIKGSLVWLDQVNGFQSCVAGRLPVNIGYPISDYQKINSQKLDYSKAVATNFHKEDLYICSIGTTTFVYDYADQAQGSRSAWYLWDRINVKSIMETADESLLVNDGVRTWKMKVTNSVYDFTDHKTAIHTVMNTAWLNQGEPIIDKKFIEFWINSVQGGFSVSVAQYGNYLEEIIGNYTNLVFIPENSDKKFVKADVHMNQPKLSAISIGIEHNAKNKWMRIQGFELQGSPEYDRSEPKR